MLLFKWNPAIIRDTSKNYSHIGCFPGNSYVQGCLICKIILENYFLNRMPNIEEYDRNKISHFMKEKPYRRLSIL